MIELDPPVHKPATGPHVPPAEARATLAAYRPIIEEITDQLIDGFIADGSVELMHGFAYRLPTHLIIRILGLSADDFDWMHAWGLIEGGRAASSS